MCDLESEPTDPTTSGNSEFRPQERAKTNLASCPYCGRHRNFIANEWVCLDCDLETTLSRDIFANRPNRCPDCGDVIEWDKNEGLCLCCGRRWRLEGGKLIPCNPDNPDKPNPPSQPDEPPTETDLETTNGETTSTTLPSEPSKPNQLSLTPMTNSQPDGTIVLHWDGKTETVTPSDLCGWRPIDEIPDLTLPEPKPLPSVIVLDIETTGLNPETDRVLAVGIAVWRDGQVKTQILKEPNETNLLQRTFELISKLAYQNPDAVLTGYNLLDFDLPFLIRRAEKLGVDCPFWVEADANGKPFVRTVAATNGTLKGEPLQFPDIRTDLGLTLVDTLHLVCRWDYTAKELRHYDLKSVAEHFGVNEPNRPILSPDQIVEAYRNDPKIFDRYLTADVLECFHVFIKLFPPYWHIAQMTRLPVSDVCVKSTAWVWEQILERHYGKSAMADDKRDYIGGLVVAREGLFSPCFKIDVASLYPTIMLSYRIHSRKDTDQSP